MLIEAIALGVGFSAALVVYETLTILRHRLYMVKEA